MSCNACKKVALPPEAKLLYSAAASHVVGKDGRSYSIMKPLFEPSRQPRGGWGVVLEINRQNITFRGRNGQSVFASVVSTLKTNQIDMLALDLWLNLNIIWLGRAVEKYQNVTLSQLMKLTKPLAQ